jgi:hypothetical protein
MVQEIPRIAMGAMYSELMVPLQQMTMTLVGSKQWLPQTQSLQMQE